MYAKTRIMGKALIKNLCHIASSHLISEDNEYIFPFLKDEIHQMPAVVNLCRHMDVGLEILNRRADVGPAIRPVANILGQDFISVCWERFDLVVAKDKFLDQGIQLFLSLLKKKVIQETAEKYGGYDLSMTGKMVYPHT